MSTDFLNIFRMFGRELEFAVWYTVIPTIQASHKVIHLKSLTVRFPHLWKCNYKNQIEIPPKSSWWHWSKLTFPVSAPAMYFPSSCSHCSLCSLPDKSQPPQTSPLQYHIFCCLTVLLLELSDEPRLATVTYSPRMCNSSLGPYSHTNSILR